MEENPRAGLQDDESDVEIEYDEDGNPIAPKKSKVRPGIGDLITSLITSSSSFTPWGMMASDLLVHIQKYTKTIICKLL
jgi:hypothetical protein